MMTPSKTIGDSVWMWGMSAVDRAAILILPIR